MIPKITVEGYYLQILALDGVGINFTKIMLGNGDAPNDYRSLTSLVNPLETVGIDALEKHEQFALLTGTFSNANTQTSFEWTEVGIFCSNPESTAENPLDDILYAYGHYQLDEDTEGAARIPAAGTEVFEIKLNYRIYIGDLENISTTLSDSQTYATKLELEQHVSQTNPHNTTAADIGLGNVPNVSTNDQTPTYGELPSLSNLISGEKLTIAFGKIAQAIKSLIEHIANSTSHITPSERVSWNSKAASEHKHSTSDITSGTLGVARGGTGVTNLASLWASLWSGRSGYLDNGKAIFGKDQNGVSRQLLCVNTDGEIVLGSEGADLPFSGYNTHIHSPGGLCMRVFSGTEVDGERLRYYLMVGASGTLYPDSDTEGYETGKQNLGSSTHRWNTIYGVTNNMSSDVKLKGQVRELESANELIMGLRPVSYTWKNDTEKRPRMGFIAQDVYRLMKSLGIKNSDLYLAGYSEAIHENNADDTTHENITDDEIENIPDERLNWGIDYVQLIAPIVKVLQEQNERIAALEKQLESEQPM